MNKEQETITTTAAVAHALVLVFFGLGCRFLWGLLHVSGAVPLRRARIARIHKTLSGTAPSVLAALVLVATFYCLWALHLEKGEGAAFVGSLSQHDHGCI